MNYSEQEPEDLEAANRLCPAPRPEPSLQRLLPARATAWRVSTVGVFGRRSAEMAPRQEKKLPKAGFNISKGDALTFPFYAQY